MGAFSYKVVNRSASAATTLCGARLGVRILAINTGELTDRERERAEETAGVILFCLDAFLIGYGIIRAVHQDLRGANNANDREDTEGDKQVVTGLRINELGREASIDGFGDLGAAAARVAALTVTVDNLARQCDRIDGIDDRRRHCRIAATFGSCTVGIEGIGAERADIPFAAEEDDDLLQDSQAFKSGATRRAHAALASQFHVRLDRDLEETVVESHFGKRNVHPKDLGTDYADVAGTVENLLPFLRHKDPYVLIAISVAARIQHPVSIDAHRAVAGIQRTDSVAISAIYHDVSPYIRLSRQHGSIVSITYYV